MSTHVNYDNMRSLLIGVKQKLNTKINAIDMTQAQKDMLVKIDKIIKTGTGTSFLSDNGTYKNIPLDKMQGMVDNLGVIYNLFNIDFKAAGWTNNYQRMLTSRYGLGCIEYNGKIYCIGGGSNKVEVYDISSNTWSNSYTPISSDRTYSGYIKFNNKIYCIGGWNGSYLNKVEVYDILSNTWSSSYKTMPTARYNFSCVENNGKIYCIGGIGDYSNKVEAYDIVSDTWTKYADFATGGYNSSIIYNNKIYCMASKRIDIYDIQSNTWGTIGVSLTINGCICIENNGKIYCIGGNSPLTNKMEVYDITNNTWDINYATMPTSRYVFGCIKYNNKIYCIGGYTLNNPTNIVEVYDIGHLTYSMTLPSVIQDKLSLLVTNGTGSKLLTDNGTYQEYIPTGYRELTTDELNILITDMKNTV